MPNQRVILSYPPESVEEPVTYRLVKDFDLMVNILKARIRPREGGRLVMELSGTKENLESGMAHLASLGIEVRPIVREIRVDPDLCCHCTACVPHCPTQALTVEHDSWEVTLNPEKCVLCETCVTVCPYRAVGVLF